MEVKQEIVKPTEVAATMQRVYDEDRANQDPHKSRWELSTPPIILSGNRMLLIFERHYWPTLQKRTKKKSRNLVRERKQ